MAVFYFAVLIKYAALVALISFSLAAVCDGCTYDSDCELNQVCCNDVCVYGSNCVGHSCLSDSDCSSGESCCQSKCVYGSSCVGKYCSSILDCSTGERCCSGKCVKGSSCVYCSSDSDCRSWEDCCNSQCKDSCLGSSCSTDSDCGNSLDCCKGICQYSFKDCHNITGIVTGAIVGTLVFICLISLCICLACRRRRALQGRVIVRGQGETATTVSTTGTTQGNPPHQGQIQPPYQQGYPCYPPVQYEIPQQMTNIPPTYNPAMMVPSEPPPPYPVEPEGGSGGVYAPKAPDVVASAPPPI